MSNQGYGPRVTAVPELSECASVVVDDLRSSIRGFRDRAVAQGTRLAASAAAGPSRGARDGFGRAGDYLAGIFVPAAGRQLIQ